MVFEKEIRLSETVHVKIGVEATYGRHLVDDDDSRDGMMNAIEFNDGLILTVRDGHEIHTVCIQKFCNVKDFFIIIINGTFNTGKRWPTTPNELIYVRE